MAKPEKAGKSAAKSGNKGAKKDKSPAAPRKTTKPPKKGKQKEPLNREERKKAAWLRKTERKVAQRAITEVGDKASAGLTFDQLENPSLATTHRSKPADPTFEQILLEVVAGQTQQFEESAKPVSLPATPDPEVHVFPDGQRWTLSWYETDEESLSSAATRKVVVDEIRSLLEKTGAIFSAFRGPDILAVLFATGEAFEKELDSPLGLRLAEAIIADNTTEAIENFLEEVYDRIVELQIVASALDSESELEKSARLGLIDEATIDRLKKAATEEAIRLDLYQRLAGLTASTGAPAEVDETFATLIAEAAQAAKDKRRERAAFRQTLLQRLRGRKEREGRRFSSERPESDEELLFFLASHQEERGAKQFLLARRLEAEIATAEKRWVDLKFRLATSGANDPERAVAQNAAAMKDLLGALAQIRTLNQRLEAMG